MLAAFCLGRRGLAAAGDPADNGFSDGFGAYPDAVEYGFGMRVDYAKLIRVYGTPREGEQRYAPAEVRR